MRQVKSHYSMQGIEEFKDNPTQLVGQSTKAILSELGYSEEEIKKFAESKVVRV